MRPVKTMLAVGILVFSAVILMSCERKVTNEITNIVAGDNAKYVGSDECAPCHSDIHGDFINSGHPYKLNKAADAQQPGYYPFGDLEGPPAGVSWSEVSYVIGGFRWKARFIGLDGKIITGDTSSTTQWNLPTEDAPVAGWVPYHPGENKNYDCGPCHMTAYDPDGHQDGLPGMIGTWALDGVQCEECHGPGEFHVSTPKDFAMKIDRSNEQCGKCHIRGSVSSIPASSGFIRHHEQWNELFSSKHLSLQCVDCHDPHKGLHEKNPDRAAAIRSECESCHFGEATAYEASGLPHFGLNMNCIECHMAKAAKSAQKISDYKADVRSHLFGINTDPDAPMFSADGGTAMGYLTLDFTCLQCHLSRDKVWAAENAASVHPTVSDGEFLTCFGCHSDQNIALVAAQQQWEYSTHASGNMTHRGTSSSCRPCHTNEGFVENVSGIEYDGGDLTVIACFTCHQPHTVGGFTPRTVAPYVLLNGVVFDYGKGNLCANCHHARRNVDTYVFDGVELSQHFGPHHSPQSDVLAGTGGYEYAGYNYTSSAHTGTTADADGCLACHMSMARGPSVGGHSFNMENHERELENLSGCNVEACHRRTGELDDLNRLADADFDGDGEVEGVMDEVRGLMHELEELLIAAGLLEYYEEDDAWEPTDDLVVSDADSAGAVYNFMFVEEEQSHGVHNTDYVVALLKSSINFISTGNPNGVAQLSRSGLRTAH